ncbi:MAG: M1 family aminopeptidase [Sandaracinus sp.]
MSKARQLVVLALAGVIGCGGGGGGGTEPHTAPPPPATTSGGDATSDADATPLRLPTDVTPTRYALTVAIDPAQQVFTGVAEIDVTLEHRQSRIWIHGQHLTVSEIVATESGREPITGEWRSVDDEEGIARVVLERPVGPGNVRLRIRYTAHFDEALEGLYRVDVGEDHYAFTQFESIAARKAFPCFDEPRFKTPFDVTLVAPEALGAFANTRELEVGTAGNGLTSHRFATTEPLPTYLVAWAVGPIDVVEGTIPPSSVRSTPLPFRGLAPRGRGPEMAFAMQHTPAIVQALEEWFGIAYPFDKLDIVAVPDFAAGAMENAGLVTFRDSLLLLSADPPVSQQRAYAFVMAHELAHQWFGDLVTMAWWDDLWLNEAFASWMETGIVQRVFPEFHAELTELTTELEGFEADSLASARQIRQPIESRHDIANAFDGITYSKGASVIMTLQHWLGPDAFQQGIRSYLAAHARGSATTADLVSALSAASHQDVGPVLDAFTLRPGIPLLATTVTCNEGAPATVSFAQSRYLPMGSHAESAMSWPVPLCVRYGVTSAGAHPTTTVQTTCGVVSADSPSITLEGNACPAWVQPNADGSSYARFTLPDEWLARLATAMSAATPRGGTPMLSDRDRVTVADSVGAGFQAGRIPFGSALGTLAPLASSTNRFVATAPTGLLSFAHDYLLEPSDEAAFQRYGSQLYASQLRTLGWAPRRGVTEDGDTRLLRAAVLTFLALEARDAGVRREAARRGQAYVAGGTIHADAVPTDLAELALTVAVQEGDAAFLDSLLSILGTSEDAVVRGNILRAIAQVDDDALRPRALALALDERLRVNEVFRPISGQFGDPAGRDAAWTWLQANYDGLRQHIGPEYAGYLPLVTAGFCTHARAEEVRAFFAPRMAETSGGPRNLDGAVEEIELCAARADANRESARAFFRAAHH